MDGHVILLMCVVDGEVGSFLFHRAYHFSTGAQGNSLKSLGRLFERFLRLKRQNDICNQC